MVFEEKIERLEEENIHPSEKLTIQIMLMVQNNLIDSRDNERFEDWSYEKVISKCNNHGKYYTEEEHREVIVQARKERRSREKFFSKIGMSNPLQRK